MSTYNPRVLVATSVGIACSAAFTGGNLTLTYLTLPSLLLPPPSKESLLPPPSHAANASSPTNLPSKPVTSSAHLSRQWAKVFNLGKIYFPIVAVSSASGFLVAASSLPKALRKQRILLVTSAALAVSIMPFTVVVMSKTNSELTRRAKAATEGNEEVDWMETSGMENKAHGGKTEDLVGTWGNLNAARAMLPAVAIACAVAGLVL